MLHEEQGEENEQAIFCLDSESEISDADDLHYVLQDQAVDDIEDSSSKNIAKKHSCMK